MSDRVLRCLVDLGFDLAHPALGDTKPLFEGLEEFRQHLGGRLTLTMLRGVGDPVDVHEVDDALMRDAIARLQEFGTKYSNGANELHEQHVKRTVERAKG